MYCSVVTAFSHSVIMLIQFNSHSVIINVIMALV